MPLLGAARTLWCWWLILPVQNHAKSQKMAETLAYRYTRRVLSESYLMNTKMRGFRKFSEIFVSLCFWQKVVVALEGLKEHFKWSETHMKYRIQKCKKDIILGVKMQGLSPGFQELRPFLFFQGQPNIPRAHFAWFPGDGWLGACCLLLTLAAGRISRPRTLLFFNLSTWSTRNQCRIT